MVGNSDQRLIPRGARLEEMIEADEIPRFGVPCEGGDVNIRMRTAEIGLRPPHD